MNYVAKRSHGYLGTKGLLLQISRWKCFCTNSHGRMKDEGRKVLSNTNKTCFICHQGQCSVTEYFFLVSYFEALTKRPKHKGSKSHILPS